MSFASLMVTAQRLQASAEALAVLGAELRIRREGLSADPQVVQESSRTSFAPSIRPCSMISRWSRKKPRLSSFSRRSVRPPIFSADPARPPGWRHEDPTILQGQGQASRRFVRAIDALAERRPDLRRVLHGRAHFLMSGRVSDGLRSKRRVPGPRCAASASMSGNRRCNSRAPTWLEPEWRNVSSCVRKVSSRLDELEVFTLAWLPPFVPVALMPVALKNLHRALVPGGWLVLSLLGAMPDPLGQALAALKLARHGTYAWTPPEAEGQLQAAGFEQVETFSPNPLTVIVVGRKAAGA